MQAPSRRHRQRLLGEAFEQGIRHFDVARMYGLGAAEREVGRFARGRRDEIVIATKFGIEASGSAGSLARLQAPARAVVRRLPALRAALKRRADTFYHPHHYDPATARASLETSLKELGTDYVDILFVHDPAPTDPIDMTELGEALEALRRAGKVRAWGISGEPEPCIELSRTADTSSLLQIRDDIFAPMLSQVDWGTPAITFGILSRALGRILDHVLSSNERRLEWSRMVGENCGRLEAVSSLLLQDALDRNSTGTVLFSTTRLERIKAATEAAEALSRGPDSVSLHSFRRLVRSELTPKALARA